MDQIRKANTEDETQIYQLIMSLEATNLDKIKFSNIYKANLSNPEVQYYVYEKDSKILGFISIHFQKLLHHVADIAEIQELIVADNSRKCGIGNKLFQKAKEVSQQNNCLQLEACCNQKRQHSHEFYYSMGMTNNHYKFCLSL